MENLNENGAQSEDLNVADITSAFDGVNDDKVVARPIPRSGREMLKHRKSSTTTSVNDAVEAVYLALLDDDDFHKAIDAVYNTQAAEGSLLADDFSACIIIRDYAKANNHTMVGLQNLATLRHCLGVVLRRFGMSRKERREA